VISVISVRVKWEGAGVVIAGCTCVCDVKQVSFVCVLHLRWSNTRLGFHPDQGLMRVRGLLMVEVLHTSTLHAQWVCKIKPRVHLPRSPLCVAHAERTSLLRMLLHNGPHGGLGRSPVDQPGYFHEAELCPALHSTFPRCTVRLSCIITGCITGPVSDCSDCFKHRLRTGAWYQAAACRT
jgi:hypothetical protein